MSAAAKSLDPERTKVLFSEERSVESVNARMSDDASPRLKEVMSAVVRHLHDLVKEVEPTHEEWFTAIQFLTQVGHKCSDWRQEFILLSDTLGVSSLVDAVNHRRVKGATENTILGPFYLPNGPRMELGSNICIDNKGEPLLVRGRVTDTEGNPIPDATVEVWQTNDDGFYDVQQQGIQPDWNLRGVFTSETGSGRYWFRTVKPRFYSIPNDGPVGRLLERLGRHPNRAAHIHFMVSAQGHEPLITHIFTPDCPYLGEDAVFGVKDGLVANFQRIEDQGLGKELGVPAPFWLVDWDFVLMTHAVASKIS